MKETERSIENKFFEMMMEKSGEERMRMGLEMFELARKSIIASISHENNALSGTEIKVELLKRCYGDIITARLEQGFRGKFKSK